MGKLTKLKLRFMKIVLIFIFNQIDGDPENRTNAIVLANEIKNKLKEESDG